jgi:YebC/PmpR family DNA-binding regulatory protein
MAGHSKWANIKRRKGAQDAKRGKVFTKVVKEIKVAVKTGGGGDPDANPRLRAAIQAAKGVNMPKDKIEATIKKATGGDGEDYQEVNYEGYANGGVAVFVETATDNLNRTVASMRHIFSKYGGNLGTQGCLQFVFDHKGVFSVPSNGLDEDDFSLEMIEAGAEDIEFDAEMVSITTAMEDFGGVQKALAELGVEPESAGLERIPTTTTKVDAKTFESVMKLIDKLEDDDDVQKVYHNIEFDEALFN